MLASLPDALGKGHGVRKTAVAAVNVLVDRLQS